MTADYFTVFSLPRCFHVKTDALEKCYFAAQREFHPDRLVGKTSAERSRAISHSMLINEAYEALKSPLKRARHLLMLEGAEPDAAKPSSALLMEIMELREALAEAQDATVIDRLSQENAEHTEDTLVSLAGAFSGPDLKYAAELAMRLSYLMKMEDEIRVKKKILSSSRE